MPVLDLQIEDLLLFVWVDAVSLAEVMSKSVLRFVCLAVYKNESFDIADWDSLDYVWFSICLF